MGEVLKNDVIFKSVEDGMVIYINLAASELLKYVDQCF
jgi:hypothetical protein